MKKFLKGKLVMLFMMVILSFTMVSVAFGDEVIENGTYSLDVTSSAAMFKVVDAKLKVVDGNMSAVITLSGTGYSKLYMGTEEEAANSSEVDIINYVADENGMYTFDIPVSALDTEINVAAFSTKNQKWYGRTLTFNSSTLKLIEEEKNEAIENGTYSLDVTSSAAMFKVVDAKLKVVDGNMSAVITLSGTGYSKLYMGTEEAAATSNEVDIINYVVDENGKYTFNIPVSALDTEINVAAFSTKNQKWYGRTLTFNSSTLKLIEEQQVEEKQDEPIKQDEAVKQTEETKEKQDGQQIANKEIVGETTQEESNPKTGDNNSLVISTLVLLGGIVIIAKNKKFIRKIQ